MEIRTLRVVLDDWTDIDFAMFKLAISLGLMSPDVSFQTEVKHVFWSDNPLGNTLAEILDRLTEVNVLQKRDEPDFQYRWNPDYRGSWETQNNAANQQGRGFRSEKQRQELSEERYREEAVHKYFDDMAYLMVEKGLSEIVQSMDNDSDPGKLAEVLKNPVWHMAQIRTTTVLRRLANNPGIRTSTSDTKYETKIDVQRANGIVDFLRDSGLLSVGGVLCRANLIGANLSGVNLLGANLSSADLSGANLSGANLFDSILSKANMIDANLQGAFLVGADLSGADLSEAVLSSANLKGAKLSGAELRSADLLGADLNHAYLSNASLCVADLSGTDMNGAYLSSSDLMGANLSGASLQGASLSSVSFFDTDLSKADLRGASLYGADLNRANLLGADLSGAKFDEKTVLPDAKYNLEEQKFDKYYDPDLGPEQMERYTNPDHPDFWQPEWVKEQANNNDEDT